VRSNASAVLVLVGRLDEAWQMAVLSVDGWWRTGLGSGWQGLIAAGEAAMLQGRWAEALRAHRLLWAIGRHLRDPVVPALALILLGRIRLAMGRPRLAVTLFEAGIRAKDQAHYRVGVVGDLSRLAVAYRELGDLAAATERHERTVRLLAELDEARWESVVYNDYAETLLATGDAAGAVSLYQRALLAAQRSGLAYEEARALDGLGEREKAREIYREMGAVESGPDQLRSPGGGSRMEA
jgi:tetratricopeptide (TPR) repeat protein